MGQAHLSESLQLLADPTSLLEFKVIELEENIDPQLVGKRERERVILEQSGLVRSSRHDLGVVWSVKRSSWRI